jgi:hypothetical protein
MVTRRNFAPLCQTLASKQRLRSAIGERLLFVAARAVASRIAALACGRAEGEVRPPTGRGRVGAERAERRSRHRASDKMIYPGGRLHWLVGWSRLERVECGRAG